MLFDRYEQQGLLFNMNFKEATSEAGKAAYRGELVLVEGEVGDAAGRRKPPTVVMRGAVLLSDGDKVVMAGGMLNDIDEVPLFFQKYGADLTPDSKLLFFVVNVAKPLFTEFNGSSATLIPLQDGMVWNELIDELKLEKGDFKGQSAADKVLTVAAAFGDYAPKYPTVGWDEVVATKTNAVREARGPV
ncbi:hypothetical protein GPA19_11800 [Azoarcus indigens]|uniref:Uncharacterized protein n=1 Tax=Azoarcus indigens TaxID=29545 RepID=A0A4V6PQL2_9RHOO|nr:hypothetical protein [Azoarcus indigens]NMG65632.1 hypothetical protein [Azoarcus indigens]TDN49962.1 hypothetical protein C7389_11055 [Azoarcus indigens]